MAACPRNHCKQWKPCRVVTWHHVPQNSVTSKGALWAKLVVTAGEDPLEVCLSLPAMVLRGPTDSRWATRGLRLLDEDSVFRTQGSWAQAWSLLSASDGRCLCLCPSLGSYSGAQSSQTRWWGVNSAEGPPETLGRLGQGGQEVTVCCGGIPGHTCSPRADTPCRPSTMPTQVLPAQGLWLDLFS